MKKVLVLLEVTVDDKVPVSQVREHIAAEARASRGQFTDLTHGPDWRGEIEVELKDVRGRR
jgi:hypothetical protein